jgi:hypothetical protein
MLRGIAISPLHKPVNVVSVKCHPQKFAMTLQFKKKFVFPFVFIFTLFSFDVFAQSDSSHVKLLTQTYFNCFSFDLPNNLTRTSEADIESSTNIIVYANEKDSIDVMIRMKKANADLRDIKELGETMASSAYNGTVQRSEFVKVDGQSVLVFLMTGYWNGAKTPSTWLKCFVVSNGSMYQFLIRFPNGYKKYNQEILNNIIHSVKVCK